MRLRANTRTIALGALVLLLGAAACGVGADLLVHRGLIHRGVTALGVDLGGRSRQEAAHLVEEAARDLTQRSVRLVGGVVVPDLDMTVTPAQMGMSVDSQAVIEEAAAYGRRGSPWTMLLERAQLWFRPRPVDVEVTVDEVAFVTGADEVAVKVERLPIDASLILTDDGPKVIAGLEGLVLDRAVLRQRLVTAVLEGSSSCEVPVTTVPPAVTTEQVQAALDTALTFLAAPVKLTCRDWSAELTVAELRAAARFSPEGLAAGRPLTVDSDEGRRLIQAKLAGLEKPPIDAQVIPDDNNRSYHVVPSQDGVRVDWETLLPLIDQAAGRPSPRHVAVPLTPWPPKLSTLDAELLQERRVLASFTTYFSPANEARVNNIRQVAAALDGRVIRPGETFSFNEAVGPRTRAAGYDEAPVISNGVLTPGVGGGICQVSTTLFNAVLLAGLPVVERWPHAFFIERYPVGRDATVSYGSQDLRFLNDSDAVLLLNVIAAADSVEVRLSGPDLQRRVELETMPIRDIVPPRSSAAHPRVLVDPTLASGERDSPEPGVDGRTVVVTRSVYTEDGRLLFQDEFVSVYEPKDWIVRVGP